MNDLFCANCETDTPHLVMKTEDGYLDRVCHVCGYRTLVLPAKIQVIVDKLALDHRGIGVTDASIPF